MNGAVGMVDAEPEEWMEMYIRDIVDKNVNGHR
jgi:hypothetical protein